MGLVFAVEAIKFHKLKQEWLVRLLFLMSLALGLVPLVFERGFKAYQEVAIRLQSLMETRGMEQFLNLRQAMNADFYSYVMVLGLAALIQILLIYLYATAYVSERQGLSIRSALLSFAKITWIFVGLLCLMGLLALFSSFLFFLPLIVVTLLLLFVPLILIEEKCQAKKLSLMEALSKSMELGRGRKFAIFSSFVFLHLVVMLIMSFLDGPFSENRQALILLSAFFSACLTLMQGRLIGIYYHFFSVSLGGRSLQDYLTQDPSQIYEDMTGEQAEPKSPSDED